MRVADRVIGVPRLVLPDAPPAPSASGPQPVGPESLILQALLRSQRPRLAGGPDDQTIDAVVQKMLAALPAPGQGQTPPMPPQGAPPPVPGGGY